MRRRTLLPAAGGLIAAPALAQGTSWPTRPVRVVVTFPPGGSSDIVARVLAEALSQRMNARFVVDNRPGAGGTIGAAHVATQPADGYTLMLSNTAPLVTSPPLYPSVAYDPVAGFAHVTYLGATPIVVVANKAKVPATDMRGLMDWIRAQPNPPGYGSSGAGSVGHIVGVLFEKETGLRLTHVPYRGSAPMQADLLGGAIPLSFDTLPQNIEHIRDGRLRGYAVTSPARQASAPELPTTAEAGLPNLLAENFLGVSGPAGLPPAVVARLNAEITAAVELPSVRARMEEHGVAGAPRGPEDFTAHVAQQVRDVGGTIRALGIRAE
ncbi:Bug family tripartite tricarboxylate transporter substrate binding protein [Roseomonas sp. CCTCC AB2023176]|uniref:Bug family tripartite tricarboxylate transporter substrate binding protein n=1 Tax=Roseomonas sp. CCTCC AB2023176 TaxID=3342640 RepID=UPI0035D9E4A7